VREDGSRQLFLDVGANFGWFAVMAASMGCRCAGHGMRSAAWVHPSIAASSSHHQRRMQECRQAAVLCLPSHLVIPVLHLPCMPRCTQEIDQVPFTVRGLACRRPQLPHHVSPASRLPAGRPPPCTGARALTAPSPAACRRCCVCDDDRVAGFEPVPHFRAFFEYSVYLNDLQDLVTIYSEVVRPRRTCVCVCVRVCVVRAVPAQCRRALSCPPVSPCHPSAGQRQAQRHRALCGACTGHLGHCRHRRRQH
jgi:hypothetical protein